MAGAGMAAGGAGGGGGMSSSSSAASTSGDVSSRGDRTYGGINIAPSGGMGFSIPPMTIAIGLGVAALYFIAKKKKYI